MVDYNSTDLKNFGLFRNEDDDIDDDDNFEADEGAADGLTEPPRSAATHSKLKRGTAILVCILSLSFIVEH